MADKKKLKKTSGEAWIGPIIPQKMLAEYMKLVKLCKKKDQMRQEILDLIDLGAKVEEGRCSVEVQQCKQVRASWKNLEKLLDKEHVQWLRDNTQPTTTKRLVVSGGEVLGLDSLM